MPYRVREAEVQQTRKLRGLIIDIIDTSDRQNNKQKGSDEDVPWRNGGRTSTRRF